MQGVKRIKIGLNVKGNKELIDANENLREKRTIRQSITVWPDRIIITENPTEISWVALTEKHTVGNIADTAANRLIIITETTDSSVQHQ
jgi:hypothetical protein